MQAELGAGEHHVVPRREFNEFAPIRGNVLHCYGVDFLSNKEVLDLFADYKPSEVQWLDDSSCNLQFPDEEAALLARQSLHNGQDPEQDVWWHTRPLTPCAATGAASDKKARKAPLKEVSLQIRQATEADRKDPGHSGHTDSVYYALVKEKQILIKQQVELRREKKRQRVSRLPGASPAPGDAAAGAQTVDGAGAAAEAPAAGVPAGLSAPLRLGCRGILDPLLYLRVGSKSQQPAGDAAAAGSPPPGLSKPVEDLADVLRRAEAEYTSLPSAVPASGARAPRPEHKGRGKGRAASAGAPKGRGKGLQDGKGAGKDGKGAGKRRERERTPSGRRPPLAAGQPPAAARQPSADGQEARGKKRRPVEQELRDVSEAAPPVRSVRALQEVEEFLARHRLRCQRIRLHRSFRSIVYGQQKRKKVAAAEAKGLRLVTANEEGHKGKSAAQPAAEEPPAWEQYFKVNNKFLRTGHFVHTTAWSVNGRNVLTVVPHEFRVDQERLARVLKEPTSAIKMRKLKEMSDNTGWPIFVCPPFGHPKDKTGRDPVLLVDSVITEYKKPILFDCGTVGLSLPVSEFLRSTGASCVERLATPQAPKAAKLAAKVAAAAIAADGEHGGSIAATPEPAPEPDTSPVVAAADQPQQMEVSASQPEPARA